MDRAKALVDRVLATLLVGLVGAAILNVLWQVFGRYVLGAPTSFTQEIARFLRIWVGVLGAGYGVGQGDHLALEILPERLEGRAQTGLRIFIQGCLLAFPVGALIVGGGRLVYVQLTLGQTSASLDIPIGYVYLVLPLSGLVMGFHTLCHVRRALRLFQGNPTDPTPSHSSSNEA